MESPFAGSGYSLTTFCIMASVLHKIAAILAPNSSMKMVSGSVLNGPPFSILVGSGSLPNGFTKGLSIFTARFQEFHAALSSIQPFRLTESA